MTDQEKLAAHDRASPTGRLNLPGPELQCLPRQWTGEERRRQRETPAIKTGRVVVLFQADGVDCTNRVTFDSYDSRGQFVEWLKAYGAVRILSVTEEDC